MENVQLFSLIRLFTCRLRKKSYVFYADGNTNTTTLKQKKPYLLQAYKTLGKIGNIIPQQIHTNTHYGISQKSTDYEKKNIEKNITPMLEQTGLVT